MNVAHQPEPYPCTCPDAAPRGYLDVKRLAKRTNARIPDLLVLDQKNDPFFSGSPAQTAQAEWFAALWQRLVNSDNTVHLRRLHYQILAHHDVLLPSGRAYENTRADWQYFLDASKHARYLGLVSADALVDQRNPAPHVHATTREQPAPGVWIDEPYFTLPRIQTSIPDGLSLRLPDVFVTGYDYDVADQPYHIEVWAEKSTMNDVLEPVCRRYGANLVTSAGFQSVTGAVSLLRRAAAFGKPVRIFYVSDFDRAGWAMPKQVARQIEFWLPDYLTAADIKLMPLVLTRAQVDRLQLPNAPSEQETHNSRFEAQQGRGVVELDALEALHPGELARIVQQAIEGYQDYTLPRRLVVAQSAAQEQVGVAWADFTADEQAEAARIAASAAAISARYEDRLTGLSSELLQELAPLQTELETLRHATERAREEFLESIALAEDGELPDRPEPEYGCDDGETWLYDSRRDYLSQLAAYKGRNAGCPQ